VLTPVNPAQEVDIRRITGPYQPGQKVCEIPSQQKRLGVVVHICIQTAVKSIKQEDCSPGQDKKGNPIFKITRAKRDVCMVQAIEHLLASAKP
jgi:hypothetical protein